jgi:RNA polymerase sigma factor (sigma-70 family)
MNRDKNTYYLEGISTRNSQVIEEIYKDILPGITSWVRQNGGNQDDAKDLFQEMIISIYKKQNQGEFTLTCTFWSYSLVVCRNLWYAKNRNKDRIKYVDEVDGEKVSLDDDMQANIEEQEQLQLYRKHFSLLAEKCQKVLSLFFAKVKMAEIAERLETSEAFIKKKKFKCKEELVERIKADPLYAELSDQ